MGEGTKQRIRETDKRVQRDKIKIPKRLELLQRLEQPTWLVFFVLLVKPPRRNTALWLVIRVFGLCTQSKPHLSPRNFRIE